MAGMGKFMAGGAEYGLVILLPGGADGYVRKEDLDKPQPYAKIPLQKVIVQEGSVVQHTGAGGAEAGENPDAQVSRGRGYLKVRLRAAGVVVIGSVIHGTAAEKGFVSCSAHVHVYPFRAAKAHGAHGSGHNDEVESYRETFLVLEYNPVARPSGETLGHGIVSVP